MLPDLIDIPCTNGQDNVAGFGGSAKFRFELFKSREETCAFNLIRQGGRGNADGVLLARGEDFRQEDHVRALQLLHEILEERGGAGIGVRLKDQHRAAVVQFLHSVEEALQLTGVMGVVILDVGAVILHFELKAAARTVEAR